MTADVHASSDPTGRPWGWLAVAAVVAAACPAVTPVLIAAGSAAAEAGGVAAASGVGLASTATTAAVAGAAVVAVAGGAAVGAGVTVAGVGGRIYSGTEEGRMAARMVSQWAKVAVPWPASERDTKVALGRWAASQRPLASGTRVSRSP